MKPSDMKDKPITEIIRELGYVGGESDYSPETKELRLPSTYSKLYATDPKVGFETVFLHKGVSGFNLSWSVALRVLWWTETILVSYLWMAFSIQRMGLFSLKCLS